MSKRPFLRKVIYLVLIAALLIPLSIYGQPATVAARNEPGSPGGRLAQLRDHYQLGQANLGEIDPAGETMKLATLGLKGVASQILWNQADKQKLKEDWTSLSATLDQLSKLQPHYIGVWRYQAWNVSYNVSVEWDDYKDRYFWVKEGIKFLQKGLRYNRNEPRLVYDLGWFTSQKIGKSDERVQYRELFRVDDDEVFPAHGSRPQNRRDNWLVGQEYFREAQRMVDNGALLHSISPVVFHSQPAMCQINYASALEEEGTFGERARAGWNEAFRQFGAYGSRELMTFTGLAVRLNDLEVLREKQIQLAKRLDELAPGVRDRIGAEKRARFSADDLAAFDAPFESRTEEEHRRAFMVAPKLFVSHAEVADRVEGPDQAIAKRTAGELLRTEELVEATEAERQVINFDYWLMRCRLERTEPALKARRFFYAAREDYLNADLTAAREKYEKGFAQWRLVLDEYPEMLKDNVGSESIYVTLEGYGKVLKQLDEPFPEDFILHDVIDARTPDFKMTPEMRQRMGLPPEA